MVEHSFTLDPEILKSIIGLVRIFFGRELMALMISSCTIGAFTYGILELFMKSGLMIKFPGVRMSEKTSRKFMISMLLIAVTFIPWIVAITPAFGQANPGFMINMRNLMFAALISLMGCWILSWILKGRLEEHSKKHFLVPEAFKAIIDVMAAHLADWVASIFIGIVNLGIKIVHKPFVLEYRTMAIIINLMISVMLISIIGVSNDAGRANLAGSVVGGVCHWWFRRKEVARLKALYTKKEEVQDEL